MITTTTLPPQIDQYFNKALLYTPHPIGEDSKTLLRMYEYIKKNLFRKAARDPKRMEKVLKLEREFLELYEKVQKKEEDTKAKGGHFTQMSLYSINSSKKNDRVLFSILKYRRKSV